MKAHTLQEIVRGFYHDMLMEDDFLDEKMPYSIKITSHPTIIETACWSVKDSKHTIFIGEKILDKVDAERDDIHHYIGSYLYHEVAHSLWTERDLQAINNALQSEGVPFRVHNLFEDALIEERMRQKSKRNFRWLDFESIEGLACNKDPLSKYFILLQSEYPKMDADEQKRLCEEYEIDERIVDYYLETLKAKNSWEVIEVIKKWKEEFPFPQKDELEDLLNEMGFGENEDLSASQLLQENEQFSEEVKQASKGVAGSDAGDDSTQGKGAEIDNDGEYDHEHSSVNFGRDVSYCSIDHNAVRSLTAICEKIFSTKSKKVPTRKPSKRLNIKGIIRDTEHIYKKRELSFKQKKKFNFVIDCSGSMYGSYMDGSATLVAIFSRLAQKGLLDGKVILSSSWGYQTLNIPLKDETIESHFVASGGEGFRDTFSCTEEILAQADINFVLTDGAISDGPLNKRELTQKGIKTFGLYVGDPETCDLSRWFNKSIAREKLSELVDTLVRTILLDPL